MMIVMGKERSGAVGTLALAALVAACSGGEARNAASADAEEGTVRAENVEIARIAPGPFEEVLRVTGIVRANRDVVLSAEETGRVKAILVDKGASVSAGQPILQIDDAVLRTQVDQARAMAELARETHERRKRLWEEDQVGSELAYLQARYEAEQAAANLATLRARLDRTTVRAPIDGVIEDRRVEVGTMVSPGTPLVRVVDITPVKVAGGVPERFAAQVATGRRVTIAFDALGSRTATGTIAFVGSTVDEQSRSFQIEVEVANPGGIIKPEMIAGIRLPLQELTEAIVVPQQALVRSETGYLAYVAVEKDGVLVAQQRAVALGPTGGNRAVVTAGLEAGDRLIVVGQQRLADGDPVNIVAEREGGAR